MRRHRNNAVIAHRDRLRQMVAFETEAPRAGLRRRAEHGQREALGRALAGAVAARRQNILQQHDVLRFGEPGRRPDCGEHIPRGFLLRRSHLLKPQAWLDKATDAKIIPAAPLLPVPGERSGLTLVGLKARKELSHAAEQFRGGGKTGFGRAENGAGPCRCTKQRRAGEHDFAAIGICGSKFDLGHANLLDGAAMLQTIYAGIMKDAQARVVTKLQASLNERIRDFQSAPSPLGWI